MTNKLHAQAIREFAAWCRKWDVEICIEDMESIDFDFAVGKHLVTHKLNHRAPTVDDILDFAAEIELKDEIPA